MEDIVGMEWTCTAAGATKIFWGFKTNDSRLRGTLSIQWDLWWLDVQSDIKATVETSGGKDDCESMMANKFCKIFHTNIMQRGRCCFSTYNAGNAGVAQ